MKPVLRSTAAPLLVFLSSLCVLGGPTAAGQEPITHARRVLDMGNAAAKSRKVAAHIKGVVTLTLPWRGAVWVYVQDSTAGILVRPTSFSQQPAPGTLVEAVGTVDAGLFAPQVTNASIASLGTSEFPVPQRLAASRLAVGEAFGQWVETEGTVRDAMREGGEETLLVTDGMTVYRVLIPKSPEGRSPERWRDRRFRFQGLVWTDNEIAQGNPGSFRLFATNSALLTEIPDAPPRVTAPAVVSAVYADGTAAVRIQDAGVLVRGQHFLPRSDPAASYMEHPAQPPLREGDEILLRGVVAPAVDALVWTDALWAKTGTQPPAPFRKVPAVEALSGGHEGCRITTEGILVGKSGGRSGWFREETLKLSANGGIFDAVLLHDGGARLPPLTAGHIVSVSGVCLRARRPEGQDGFMIRLDSAESIRDLGPLPSLWNRLGWRWGVPLVLMALTPLGMIAMLRRRIAIQRRHALAQAGKEAAIRASESKFRLLFERSRDPMLLLDGRTLRFIDFNEAALDLMRCSREELSGLPPWEISPEFQPDGQPSLIKASFLVDSLTEMGSRHFEWTHSRRDGSDFPVEVMLTSVELGTQPLIFVIWREIAERKRMEAALLELNAGLERRVAERTSELLAANEKLHRSEEDLNRNLSREKELNELKSAFVSMVSHEFRTPLGIIMSSSEILDRYFNRMAEHERLEHLASISRNSSRMAGMMEEMLLLSRLDAGRMECRPKSLSLQVFCRRLIDDLIRVSGEMCPVLLTVEPEAGREAQADENLLRHALTNLLSNAVKYSPEGRPVTFRVRRAGAEAVFEITDKGIGIPEHDLPHLFEAFHRGSNVGQRHGTGLGLVIVKRCVELHSGRLEVSTTEGKGSIFTVHIPLFI